MAFTALITLLAAFSSAIAFAPPEYMDARDFLMDEEMNEEAEYQARLSREIQEAKQHADSISPRRPDPASSGGSFASSGAFSGSSSSAGAGSFGGSFGMSPDYYGAPALPPFQTYNNQRPQQYMPYDFYAMFQEFFRRLQIIAQQHAYASNYYTPSVEYNTVDYETAPNSDVNSGTGSFSAGGGSGYGDTGYKQPSYFGFPFGGGVASSGSFSGSGAGQGGFGGSGAGQGGFGSSGAGQGGFGGSGTGQGGFGGSGTLAGAGETPAVSAGGAVVDAGSSPSQQGGDVSGAAAVASLSPQGGFGYADVFPDVSSRFGAVGGEFPKPSGNSYGVFTSSSSGSSDINGKKTSYKSATTGINDNGKITVFTKHDP